MTRNRRWASAGKRLVDIAGASVAMIALAPVMGWVAVAILRETGRPVLFIQMRPGVHGRPFRLTKFRTMTNATGPDGSLLSDDDRLTPLGATLRRLSLDELPELWNILRGDMSLVGPRPLLMEYVGLFSEEQARRHDMKPGLTGLAQVNGRNRQSWEDRLVLDVWYIDHWSPWLDCRILLRTVFQVLSQVGISSPGQATMPRFQGGIDA